MGKYVTGVEAGFVRMVANRTVRFAEEAARNGEEFHDLRRPTLLDSGYRVKLTHMKEGPTPVVAVWPPGKEFIIVDVVELASELLAQPAKFVGQVGDHLEFVPDV